MAGRASIVGAAATHVGKVRDHNEDAHFIDVERGLFLVCDGMGGHAAGEVASEIAITSIREEWGGDALHGAAERWLERGTADAKRRLLEVVRAGVVAAHGAILSEARRDETKSGMGTTLVGAIIVGGELVFAHAGDSRAYLVRDGISMQLTEDHTLLARLLAAGIDVDVSGEGSRFRSMLTNALGIGEEVKVSTFVVPLADGDRFLLCSDGISEYVKENEIGDVLTQQPSPARGAQKLIDLALERGGGDNATAVVVRVLEAGETPLPAEQRTKDDAAIGACALWGKRVTPQQRLRALRIAIPRDHNLGDKLPPHALGDRVAWIVVDGQLVQDGRELGPGALVYPESLLAARESVPLPDRDAHAITRSDVRALAIRADDFRELCEDDTELGEALLESLAVVMAKRKPRVVRPAGPAVDPRGATDPHLRVMSRDGGGEDDDAHPATDPELPAVDADEVFEPRDRAATVPDDPRPESAVRNRFKAESPIIAPAAQRPASPVPARPSPPLPATSKVAGGPPSRPSPLPARLSPPSRPSPMPAQAKAAQAKADGAKADGAKADGAKADGAKADGAKADGAKAGGAKPNGTKAGAASPAANVELTAAPTPVRTPTPGAPRGRQRPPTEPEIETYLEIEADLPELDGDPDPESALALRLAFGAELDDDERAARLVEVDHRTTRVIETDDGSEVTVTVSDAPAVRPRAITADDGTAVSGTISRDDDDGESSTRSRDD